MGKIRVGVMGACGKMGREICSHILDDSELELTAAIDVVNNGSKLGVLIGRPQTEILINNLHDALDAGNLDVLIDFTNAQAVLNNSPKVIARGINLVIGTTGLSVEEVNHIETMAEKHQVGVIAAPNFSIGAVLMIKFAKDAAQYFPHLEIIEKHHDQKLDAPSGTAIKTLEEISKNRSKMQQGHKHEYEKIIGARGGDFEGIRVHSIRLPGLIAHQEVIFGGEGQILTIKHDSLSRDCFMPGILLAVKKVRNIKGLCYGLENIL
ncbi:MAG: 4-hydroxy-tetrahydrodipicolinate reductase [Bacillota bacterium]